VGQAHAGRAGATGTISYCAHDIPPASLGWLQSPTNMVATLVGGNCLPTGVALLYVRVKSFGVGAVPVLAIRPVAVVALVWVRVIRPAQSGAQLGATDGWRNNHADAAAEAMAVKTSAVKSANPTVEPAAVKPPAVLYSTAAMKSAVEPAATLKSISAMRSSASGTRLEESRGQQQCGQRFADPGRGRAFGFLAHRRLLGIL